MKIDKKLIKELVDNLKEFNLTELEYQDGQTKIKVSKAAKTIETSKTSSVVSPNKTVLKNSDDSEGIRVKSPIIGTAYLAPEPGAKKFVKIGDKVILNGFGVGEKHWGGMSQKAKVKGDWLVKLPEQFSQKHAMAIGTAGYTAMLCVLALEKSGIDPKKGEILVTGATGGVGSIAVMILSKMGYNVHAVTGKKDKNDYLKDLGAKNIIDRKEFEGESKLLEKGTWDGVVDTVGGSSLTKILAQVKPNGIVASCGNAGGIKINTTVMPFIIRGVKLWGIDSSGASIRRREFLWNEAVKLIDFNKLKSFTKSLSFSELLDTYPKLLEGKFFGRAIVNPNK